jgi:RND family efflux transporter MFP subunit
MSAMLPRRPLLRILPLLAVLLYGCGDESGPSARQTAPSPEPAAPATPVRRVETPAPPPLERRGWTGVVVARESVDVTAEAQGRVQAIYVQIGDAVAPGARIASLDAAIPGQDLEMARSSLRASEADAQRATEELGAARVRNERRLANPELFSKEELAEMELGVKTATAAVKVAEARVSEARARVRQLEAALGQSEVRAPFAGRVAERFVDQGAVVGPGTALVRLISAGDLMVRAAVPPEEARNLAVGDPVTAKPRDAGDAVRGTVQRIAPEVDAASQMVLIEVRLDPNTGGRGALQTGQVVDVRPTAT